MERRRIGVGLVGYGLGGRVFHAPLITAEHALELRAVATSRRAEVEAAYPGVAVVGAIDDLLADPAIELVVITTPNTAHVPLATAALHAGRHVVVDKPFTIRAGDAEMLASLAAERDRVLSVYQNRRWDADFLTVRRVLADGTLGRVHTAYIRFDRWQPVAARGWRESDGEGSGLLYDFGAHTIDQALVLFGRPRTVQCIRRVQRAGTQADDFFHLVLGFDGLDAIVETSSFVRPERPRFELYGERGSLRKSGMDPQDGQINDGMRPGDPAWGIDPVPALLTTGGAAGDEAVTREVSPEVGCYEAYYRGVAAAIRDGIAPPVTANEACDTIRVVEYAIESDATGRTITTEWARGR